MPNINLIINRNIKRPRRRQIKTLNLNPVCIFVGMMMRKTKKRTHHAIANIAEKNRDDGFSCKRSLKFQSSIEMRAKSRSSNLWEHLIIIGGHFPTKQPTLGENGFLDSDLNLAYLCRSIYIVFMYFINIYADEYVHSLQKVSLPMCLYEANLP